MRSMNTSRCSNSELGYIVVQADIALLLAEVCSLEVPCAEHPGVQVLGTEAHRGFQRSCGPARHPGL